MSKRQCFKCREITSCLTCPECIQRTVALDRVGIPIASRLSFAASTEPDISEAIYAECRRIAKEVREDDWLEFPDGTMFKKVFPYHNCFQKIVPQ